MRKGSIRKPISELMSESSNARNKSWISSLNEEDLLYVKDVALYLRKSPAVSIYILAENLRIELGITTSKQTIVRTLKELMNEKA